MASALMISASARVVESASLFSASFSSVSALRTAEIRTRPASADASEVSSAARVSAAAISSAARSSASATCACACSSASVSCS